MDGMNVGTIYYEVESDTAQLVNSTVAVDGSLDHLQQTMRKTDGAAAKLETKMDKVAAAAKNFGREANTANSSVSGLLKLMGGLLTLQGANTLIQMAEAYGEMAERVRMATGSQEEYEMVQQRLLATANGTYRSLAEAQEVYIRTADSLRSMGYSTAQVLDITDSMSYAFVKNATSVDRANSAIDAYTKSINKGKVESDSWESIIAAIPTVINDIATASGKTSAEIREMGASGKITAQMLNEGLRQSFESNKAAADGMATTVKDAFTNLRNVISAYLGEANMASGATGVLSKAIILLGNNIDLVVKTLLSAGAGALAAYIAKTGAMAVISIKAMLAARAQAAEELNLARAHAATTAATLANAEAQVGLTVTLAEATAAKNAAAAADARLAAAERAVAASSISLMGILGGPVGIIALVASAAAGIYLFSDSATSARPPIDELTASLEGLGGAMLTLRRQQMEESIADLEKDAAKARVAYDRLAEGIAIVEKRGGAWAENLGDMRKQLVESDAAVEQANENLKKHRDALAQINAEIEKRKNPVSAEAPAAAGDPQVAERLQAMRDELALTKLQGEARIRLQAIQKLGATATAEERAEAAGLAVQIDRIEKAREALTKSTQEAKQAEEQNLRVIYDLNEALLMASKSGEELAVAKALSKLNPAASAEEVANVEALARALYKVQEATDNTALLGQMDPYAGEQQHFEQQLENLRKLNEAYDEHTNQKLLSDQRYLELKTSAEQEHAAAMAALEEERFRQQSAGNELVMATLDQLKYATTDVFMSMLDGTFKATDAVRALGGAILREAVSAIAEMGIAQVKAWIIGQSAQAAAAAASVAAGATVAAAWAPAAAAVSLASFGANAAPAAAGIASTYGVASALSIAGGRQYGGDVAAQKLYRITEGGRPEVYNAANGQQFLLPGTRGNVEPIKSSNSPMQVNVHNYSGVQVDTRQRGPSQVDVIIQAAVSMSQASALDDARTNGPVTRTSNSRTGARRKPVKAGRR